MKIQFDQSAIGDLGLRGESIRNLVDKTTAEMGAALQAEIGDKAVIVTGVGQRRARGYVRRLDMRNEVVDGRLSRILHGGS